MRIVEIVCVVLIVLIMGTVFIAAQETPVEPPVETAVPSPDFGVSPDVFGDVPTVNETVETFTAVLFSLIYGVSASPIVSGLTQITKRIPQLKDYDPSIINVVITIVVIVLVWFGNVLGIQNVLDTTAKVIVAVLPIIGITASASTTYYDFLKNRNVTLLTSKKPKTSASS